MASTAEDVRSESAAASVCFFCLFVCYLVKYFPNLILVASSDEDAGSESAATSGNSEPESNFKNRLLLRGLLDHY